MYPSDITILAVYGIPRQVHSSNLLVLNFHEWIDMFRDVMRPGSLGQRLKHHWGPPEYQRISALAEETVEDRADGRRQETGG
jgi:hypothetical protein